MLFYMRFHNFGCPKNPDTDAKTAFCKKSWLVLEYNGGMADYGEKKSQIKL